MAGYRLQGTDYRGQVTGDRGEGEGSESGVRAASRWARGICSRSANPCYNIRMYSAGVEFTGSDIISVAVALIALMGALTAHFRVPALERLRSKLQIDVEAFKVNLAAEREVDVEKLRSQLALASRERELLLANLQAKRAEVIHEVYGLLVNTVDAFADLTSWIEFPSMGTKEERERAFVESYNQFARYYHMHRVYLDARLCQRFEKLMAPLRGNFERFKIIVIHGDQKPSDDYFQAWQESWEAASIEIPALLRELEQDFRALLGVSNAPAHKWQSQALPPSDVKGQPDEQ